MNEAYEMSLEILVAWESKEMLKFKNLTMMGMSTQYWDNWENSQWPKLTQFEQQNKVILDYNPKCKINVNYSIMT